MRNQSRVIVGVVVIAIGFLFLFGSVFRINVWAICWPVGLIAVGVWLLVRPSMVGPGTRLEQKVLGDIRRDGAWDVVEEEIWLGVGDLRLDMTDATVPTGETRLRVFGFVGDVNLVVPEGIGVSISSWAFLTEGKVFGKAEESFVVPLQAESDGYVSAERRIRVETYFFVHDLKVERG